MAYISLSVVYVCTSGSSPCPPVPLTCLPLSLLCPSAPPTVGGPTKLQGGMYIHTYIHRAREAQRGPERPREAQRGPERGQERPREASGDPLISVEFMPSCLWAPPSVPAKRTTGLFYPRFASLCLSAPLWASLGLSGP